MTIREYLDKKASMEEPDYRIDNHAVALKEHKENMSDAKSVLKGLFDNVGKTETGESKLMSKTFPGKVKHETGNPLLKLAGSYSSVEVVKHAFLRELDKINDARR